MNACLGCSLAACLMLATSALGQTVNPPFDDDYSVTDLGIVPGVPTPYGGMVFARDNPNVLLIGGAANTPTGAIYSIGLTRGGDGRITGFSGTATLLSTAPGIDGGLAYAFNGTLIFTGFPTNVIGQILPGDATPARITDVTTIGITSSVGSLLFVPPGNPGAGLFKVMSYNASEWYDVDLVDDGGGLFTLAAATLRATTEGGTEGAFYVPPCSAGFFVRSMIVSEWDADRVATYAIDANGDPIPATYRPFITDLVGAEGAVVDPLTGDFMFCTFVFEKENHVFRVQGFPRPCPADFNQDCFLNGKDFDEYVQAFEAGDVTADFDGDRFVTGIDFDLFVQAFEVGC